MKSRRFCAYFVIALTFTVFSLPTIDVTAESSTLVHNIDTGLDYSTIQDAINSLETLDGHTLQVEAGTYYEHVVINKSITLVGADVFTTVIDGNGTGHVVRIRSDNVSLTGFTIRNSGRTEGPASPGNCGLLVKDVENCTIHDNIVENNKYGLWLIRSVDNTLRGNVLRNNSYNFRVTGRYLSHFVHDIDPSNTVDGKPIHYLVNRQNENVPSDAGYVAAVNSTNIQISDLNLSKNGQGVLLAYVQNATVQNVTAISNYDGIWIGYSTRVTVVENNASHNGHYGIYLLDSSYCTVIRNDVNNNGYEYLYYGYGIALERSLHCSVTENNAKNDYYGIVLLFSRNCTIDGNDASQNSGMGIWPKGSEHLTIVGNNASHNLIYGIEPEDSTNCLIVGNNVSENGFHGVWLLESTNLTVIGNHVAKNEVGIRLLDSDFNRIYYNNFIDNEQHAVVEASEHNRWDDGYEGNYWSTHPTWDTNSDGVSDAPYFIDEYNIDARPVLGLFSTFTARHAEEVHEIRVICNSTISGFEYSGVERSLSFYVTGEDGVAGFCRICIPKALIDDPYYVLVDDHEPLLLKQLPASNSTHEYLYFTYTHSTLHVAIVPEFSWLLFFLILAASTAAVVLYSKRRAARAESVPPEI